MKNNIKSGIIDLDIFLDIYLERYNNIVLKVENDVKPVFIACDLNESNLINLNEFLLLSKHIGDK